MQAFIKIKEGNQSYSDFYLKIVFAPVNKQINCISILVFSIKFPPYFNNFYTF